jgi:hypothetical protein
MLTDIRAAFKLPEWVEQAREDTKRLRVHLHGTKQQTADYLDKIEKYETFGQYEARRKSATPNKALFSELLRPVDKVFDAKGGAKHYNVKSDKLLKEFRDRIADIEGGRSVTDWLQQIWIDKFMTDPSGVIFMEWEQTGQERVIYPTFKSIDTIRNYSRDGRQVEWIIFEPVQIKDSDTKLARVVDDVSDRYYDVTDADNPKLYEGDDPHYIEYLLPVGHVPALVSGAMESADLKRVISMLDVVLDLADHYLRTTSVKNIHEFQHGIPVYWEYQSNCPKCNGTGMAAGGKNCDACGGTGVYARKDVTDKKVIRIPANDQQKITPDVAGFVEPSHQTWEQFRTEQRELIKQIHSAFWGTHRKEESSNDTATGRFIDQQPVNDKLSTIAGIIEATEEWIIDTAGEFWMSKIYHGCSISYGRRFLIEPAAAVWEDYQRARKEGAPESALDYKLIQYWQSELRDDALGMAYQMLMMQVEPFVHMTVQQVLDSDLIPAEDKMMKLYFSDWTDTLSRDDLMAMQPGQIREKLRQYVTGKSVTE